MTIITNNLWKRWSGRCIHKTDGGLRVFDNYFHRTLKIGSDAYQTVLNIRHPEKPVLAYLLPFIFMAKRIPGNTCVLGLGGGAAAHALAPDLTHFHFKITAVEYNPEVIDAAYEYFMIKKIKEMTIIAADANSYITEISREISRERSNAIPETSQSKLAFKHILIDIFSEESLPPTCFNETFFSNCKKCLEDDGFLAVNVANKEEHRPVFNFLQQQFGTAIVSIPVKKSSNIIFIATNAGSVTPLLNCIKESMQLKSLTWDGVWGAVAELK